MWFFNWRASFIWWSEEEKRGERGGGVFVEMTSEGDRREMKDVETDRKRGGGICVCVCVKKTHREGWGWEVLCFFSWNAAPRLSEGRWKTQRLFSGKTDVPHSCCEFSPPLVLVVWGQRRGGGALVGVGEVTEGREKEKGSSGDQGDSQTLSTLSHHILAHINCWYSAHPLPPPQCSVYLPARVTMRVLLLICMQGNAAILPCIWKHQKSTLNECSNTRGDPLLKKSCSQLA